MAKGKYQEWLTPEKLTLLQGWAADGLQDIQIAKNMGISKDTYYRWIKLYSDFYDAIKKGREVCDYQVQNELFRRATGYWTEETKTEEMLTEFGTMVVAKKTTVRKFVPADTTAQIFWLKNRKPDEWKDKREEKIDMSDNQITVHFEGELDDYAD